MPEYATGGRRVDYALSARPRTPALFLEVKRVGQSADADRQLFEYAFHEGAQIAVLTDGRMWNFYLPGQHGSYDDRRVYQLDLVERPIEECERRFIRYLSRERVASNAALSDAQSDYSDRASQREAEAIMPSAWAEIIGEPDGLLIDLLRERTEAMSGHRPTDQALELFLRNLIAKPLLPALAARRTQPRAIVEANATEPKRPETLENLPETAINRWRLGATSGKERDQVSAMVAILSALFEAYPDKREQMAAASRTRSRNAISKLVSEIYPNRPEIAAKQHRSLPGGWFVGTNESSGTKMQIVTKAANACGLTWGSDVELHF